MAHHGQLHDRQPAKPESIPRLRWAVVDFATANGASQRQLEDIALAVSEAVSNAVLHAYIDDERHGLVVVDAQIDDRALEVVVHDRGLGLRPREDSPVLGWGLALIDRITERLRFGQSESGLRLRMRFPIG